MSAVLKPANASKAAPVESAVLPAMISKCHNCRKDSEYQDKLRRSSVEKFWRSKKRSDHDHISDKNASNAGCAGRGFE